MPWNKPDFYLSDNQIVVSKSRFVSMRALTQIRWLFFVHTSTYSEQSDALIHMLAFISKRGLPEEKPHTSLRGKKNQRKAERGDALRQILGWREKVERYSGKSRSEIRRKRKDWGKEQKPGDETSSCMWAEWVATHRLLIPASVGAPALYPVWQLIHLSEPGPQLTLQGATHPLYLPHRQTSHWAEDRAL